MNGNSDSYHEPNQGQNWENAEVHFEIVMNANGRHVALSSKRQTVIGGCPKVFAYDMLGEQLRHYNLLKLWEVSKVVIFIEFITTIIQR